MKTLLLSLVLWAGSFAVSAQTVKIVNADVAKATSYVSAEFNGPIAKWMMFGQMVDRQEVRRQVLQSGATACVLWMMDWSPSHSADKSTLQSALLGTQKQIPLWKRISGRAIYLDEASSAALSFVCVSRGESGELVEVDPTDVERHFEGVLEFTP